MSINLTVSFAHPIAIAHRVRYARIDNVTTPVYTTVSPDPTTSPATIALNIPSGQYAIEMTPLYADGRHCNPEYVYTDPCEPLLAFSAIISGNNILVAYQAPSGVPKVRVLVNYPNGGRSVANYVNNGFNIAIPIPTGVYGDFTVTGQSVCDESSSFFSAPSGIVTLSRYQNNTSVLNNGSNATITSVLNISGYTVPTPIAPAEKYDGVHGAFGGAIVVSAFKDTTVAQQALLYINGTFIECVNFPTVEGAVSATFSSRAYAASDVIYILFRNGAC